MQNFVIYLHNYFKIIFHFEEPQKHRLNNYENILAKSSNSVLCYAELKTIFYSLLQAEMVLENLSPDSVFGSENMIKMFPFLVEKLRKMEKLPALFFL